MNYYICVCSLRIIVISGINRVGIALPQQRTLPRKSVTKISQLMLVN